MKSSLIVVSSGTFGGGGGGVVDSYAGKTVVIGVAGQSNAIGRFGPIDGTLDATNANILMLLGGAVPSLTTASDPIDHFDETPDTVGHALTFAKLLLSDYNAERVVIVGMGEGGTGFIDSDWETSGISEDNTYSNARNRWEFAYSLAVTAYGAGNVVAGPLLWTQGEQEIVVYETLFSTSDLGRLQYNVMPLSMFEIMRRRDFTGMDENTPVIVASVPSGSGLISKSSYGEVQAGIAAMQGASNNIRYVDGTDLGKGDTVHYNAAAQRTLGERMAAQIANIAPTESAYNPQSFSRDAGHFETAFAFSAVGVADGSPLILQEGASYLFNNIRANIAGGAIQFDGDATVGFDSPPTSRAPKPYLVDRDFVIKGVMTINGTGTQGILSHWSTVGSNRSMTILHGLVAGRLQIYGSGSGLTGTLLLDAPVSSGVEFSFEFRRVGALMTLLINGVEVDTFAGAVTFRTPIDSVPMEIGQYLTSKLEGEIKSISLEYLS